MFKSLLTNIVSNIVSRHGNIVRGRITIYAGWILVHFGATGSCLDRPTTVGADRPTTVGADRPADVGADRPMTVGADRPASVGADRPATVGADRPVTVGADHPSTVGADRAATVDADHLWVASRRCGRHDAAWSARRVGVATRPCCDYPGGDCYRCWKYAERAGGCDSAGGCDLDGV